jgi:hypothetical protein
MQSVARVETVRTPFPGNMPWKNRRELALYTTSIQPSSRGDSVTLSRPLGKTFPFGSTPAKVPFEEILARIAVTRTPAYRQKFQSVLDEAKAYLTDQLQQGFRGPVVLDLDETLMDNTPGVELLKTPRLAVLERQWMIKSQVPAIPEALAFVRWLETEKIPYYFVSGKPPWLLPATEINLKNIGVTQYAGIYLKPDKKFPSTGAFKVWAREQITKLLPPGQEILASVGDQVGDVTGPFMKRGFLLPNDLYKSK